MTKYLDMIYRLLALLKTPTINERKISLEISGNIECSYLKDISLLHTVKAFQGSLYIKVMSQVGDPLEIKCGLSDSDYLELVEELIPTDGSVTRLTISLMKDKLIETIVPAELLTNVNLLLFVHTQHFISWFSSQNVEEIFQKDRKTIVILLDEIHLLENEFITVLGKCSIEQTLTKVEEAQCFTYNKQKTIDDRNSNCNWGSGTKFVTPDYFHFDSAELTTPGDLQKMFDSKLVLFAVAFLASLTQIENNKLQSTINGYKTVKLDLSISVSMNASTVYSLYLWAYSSKTSDKLGILRNISSLYLKGDPAINLTLFCENIEDILNSAKSSFEIYLKENVKLYFDQKKKIEESVQSKVKEITQEISSVLDSMNKNVFAAIGLIAGSMLTYVNNGNKSIVVLALGLYIAFLFINTSFYGTYTMISVRQAGAAFTNYIQYVKKTMTEEDVNTLVGNTVENKKVLFYWVWGAMMLLSIGLLGAGAYVIHDIDYLLSLVPAKSGTP